MIRQPDHLAIFISSALQKQPTCRIYQDVVVACFSPDNDPIPQADKILAFAAEHGWQVEISMPGNYGLVFDFSALPPAGGG